MFDKFVSFNLKFWPVRLLHFTVINNFKELNIVLRFNMKIRMRIAVSSEPVNITVKQWNLSI
jgi:hypothetical protein